MFDDFFGYLAVESNWTGSTGILVRMVEHLGYSALAVVIAACFAIPLGLVIGHTGRGTTLVVGLANVLRAIPSLGLMTFLILFISNDLVPPLVALVILGLPPLLAGAYAGVANVSRSTIDAARSMGMTEARVLFQVEVPNALPLIVGGFRGAVLQVVATATIAAYVNLGGLGRYIFDGLATYNYGLVLVGAILVSSLCIGLDALLAGLVRVVQPGFPSLRRPDRALEAEIARRS
jgi:osmoprotectant transport system permease protein